MVVYQATYRTPTGSKKSFKIDSKNKRTAMMSACRIIWRRHSTHKYGDYTVTKSGRIKAKNYCKKLSVKRLE